MSPFSYADLVTKMALADAGHAVSHLSAFSRGFSPNSCWEWTHSRFGMKVLSPLRTRIEDRYLRERVVMPLAGGFAAMRTLEQRLRAGGPGLDPSRRRRSAGARLATARGHDPSRHRTGESRARHPGRTASGVLPAAWAGRFRRRDRARPPAPWGRSGRDASDDMVRAYAVRLEAWVIRQPHMWSGWYQLPVGGAAAEGMRLAG